MADEDELTMYVSLPVKLSLLGPVLWGIADASDTADLTAVMDMEDPEVPVIRIRHVNK